MPTSSQPIEHARWVEPPECEDCGETATRQTADGVWLCEGDFDLLVDRARWSGEQECSL